MFRRRRLPPDLDDVVARTIANWSSFDADEQARLLDDTRWLLRKKRWESARGFRPDDSVRVVIAAQAALLILGLSRDHYRLVRAIIVHPSTHVSTGERAGPIAGTRTRGPLAVHGLASDRTGPLLVAWDQVLSAARHPERGHNVVFHEFAHKIDMLDGSIDGSPPLAAELAKPWVRVCTRIYRDMRRGNPHPPLRRYGATNPGEFFAVATEVFFDVPVELRENEPELYRVLVEFYRQDPAARLT